MPKTVQREDDIDSAYDYSPTANRLADAESNTSDNYTNAGIDQAEAYANDPGNSPDAVKQRESSADDSNAQWQVNRTKGVTENTKSRGKQLLKIAKKGGPTGAIIALLLGAASMFSFFGGPGLMIVNFAEVLSNKFNHQVGSLEVRNNRIMYAKLNNTTTGVCKGIVSIRCKFSTFSEKEITRFRETPGLKVNVAKETIFGRYKITSFEYGGDVIKAENYAKAMKSNPGFNSAMKHAYSMKLLSTSDSKFLRTLSKFKTSKKAPFPEDADDETRAKTVVEETKNGRARAGSIECDTDACKAERDRAASDAEKNNSLADEADSSGRSQAAAVADDISSIEDAAKTGNFSSLKGVSGSVTSIFKITGPIDNSCMVYGWVKTIGILSKAIRTAQMARYAMIFMSTASMIKAGDARPGDVAFIGATLTKIVKDNKGNLSKSATDSFGYRYAAYGDKGITAQASPYIAGASFGGKLQSAVNFFLSSLGGKTGADKTCKVLANPFVQIGSAVVGIASFFVGIGEAKLTIQAAMAPLIAVASIFLPAMIADLTAGTLVDKFTFGEKSGDIVASGIGGVHSASGTLGGNTIMNPEDAQAYVALNDQVLADYAEFERSTTSPFDASNPNTFLGSIYARLSPIFSNSGSIYAAAGGIGTIVGGISKNIASPAYAADGTESFTECTDLDYRALNIATDPFCNPITGIPPKYLGVTPDQVIQDLLNRGYITDDGTPTETYKEFITNCPERESPYGVAPDGEEDKSAECFIENQQKANQFIYLIDNRINDVFENGYSSTAANDAPVTTCSSPATRDGAVGEWGGYSNGKIPGSALKAISFAPGEMLNPQAECSLEVLNDAYKQEFGVNISVTDSYRSYDEQVATKAKRGSFAAEPGTSDHGWGLALDLGGGISSYTSPQYKWMLANASKYGWVAPPWAKQGGSGPPEPWHWEYALELQ